VQVECNLLGLHAHYLSDGLNEEFNFHTYAGENCMNAVLVLELVSFVMGKTNYNFTYQERADEAIRIKEAGTKLFRK